MKFQATANKDFTAAMMIAITNKAEKNAQLMAERKPLDFQTKEIKATAMGVKEDANTWAIV